MNSAKEPSIPEGQFAHDAVMFDKAELDLTLLEMGIQTGLAVEVQHSLLGRVMLSLSLAASVQDPEVFEKSIERLGPISSPVSAETDSWREEYRFYLEVLRRVGADLSQELEGESLPDYDQFVSRMHRMFETARLESGVAVEALAS